MGSGDPDAAAFEGSAVPWTLAFVLRFRTTLVLLSSSGGSDKNDPIRWEPGTVSTTGLYKVEVYRFTFEGKIGSFRESEGKAPLILGEKKNLTRLCFKAEVGEFSTTILQLNTGH